MLNRNELVELISDKILNDEAALFVAAGLSQSADYCSWKELLLPCAQKLKLEINDDTDLYLLAQYYANTYGEPELRRIISEKVNLISKESDLITSLLKLNIKDIWTTNFDRSLEQKLFKQGIISKTISRERDLTTITDKHTTIFKLNGDISNLDRMVVTKNDYNQYLDEHQMFITFLTRELATKTFLFIGYSFKDSLILNCLDQITKCFSGASPYHYTILKKDESPYFKYFVDDLEKRYRIKTLIVDDFDEIPNIIDEISNRVKNRKIFISGSFDWLSQEQDIYADNLCQQLVDTILENNYRICTGLGRKLGNYISGHAYQYCITHNINKIEKHLIMKPFHELMQEHEKTSHREAMINDCNISIFAYGKSPSKENQIVISKGVLEEFAISKKYGKYIIPLGTTGFASKQIFNEIKKNIIMYPYLEKYIEILENEDNIAKLCKTVLSIIQDINYV